MPQLHIRRATVDDLPALRSLWAAARLPADELENRLTEFQVVEDAGRFAASGHRRPRRSGRAGGFNRQPGNCSSACRTNGKTSRAAGSRWN